MEIIPHTNIDFNRWDALVASDELTPYDYSYYLNAVSEKWYVYADPEYTKGFAFSTASRLGVENVTIAPFVRAHRFYGNWTSEEISAAFREIKKRFRGCIFQSDRQIGNKVRSYQIAEEISLSSHAKRNIQKAGKNNLIIRNSEKIEPAFRILAAELEQKIAGFNKDQQTILFNLLIELNKNKKLIIKEIVKENKVIGGLFFFKGKARDLYIKGGADEEGKKSGGMYFAMYQQIQETLEAGKVFDFDGSEVPGVKRFNHYFGSTDHNYYQVSWDNNPVWYKTIRKLYLKLKK
ncbi:MAG: hypothetical protein J0G96_14340 [Flavobacteriia bacterium]|nr:hypothetical protein [Flavobacteriia bacterium]OJX39171.1 MAG: hypothetical protein BGO87_04090 [Flavobacteriia bacterium 40-80]